MCEVVTNIHNVLFSLLEKPENVPKVQWMYGVTLGPPRTVRRPLLDSPISQKLFEIYFIIVRRHI